jgi:hypothetical protein
MVGNRRLVRQQTCSTVALVDGGLYTATLYLKSE